MNQEKIIYFKGLLEGRLHALLEEAGKTVEGMGDDRVEAFPDPTDRLLWNRTEFRAEDQGSRKKIDSEDQRSSGAYRRRDLRHLRLVRKTYL